MVSGRAGDFLARRFDGVNRIHGFHLISEDNRVRRGKTVWSNVLAGALGVPRNIAAYFELIDKFEPEVVISDFESWTYYYAKVHELPIFDIDNMQIINRCTHPDEILADAQVDFQLTRAFVKSKLPFCDHYFITSFVRPPVRKERTTLVPPILRPEILEATARRGDHLLVYQTGESFKALAGILEQTGLECRVYGMRRDIGEDQVEGNLCYRPFSEQGFIDDLASARAVIASAGFTLMGEAVYLRKPMLAVPLGRQFEQLLNARYLRWAGYGESGEDLLADPTVVTRFLGRIDHYEARLGEYSQDGNRELFDALGAALGQVARH